MGSRLGIPYQVQQINGTGHCSRNALDLVEATSDSMSLLSFTDNWTRVREKSARRVCRNCFGDTIGRGRDDVPMYWICAGGIPPTKYEENYFKDLWEKWGSMLILGATGDESGGEEGRAFT